MESIWVRKSPGEKQGRKKLPEQADIVIIGGGMSGILCSWLLKEAGKKSIVLEAASIGSGQTGGTTAKITAQHGLIYSRLSETVGDEAASRYGRANMSAIEEYERIISEKGIECNFERLPAFLYSNTENGASKLEKERSAAVRAGIPASIVYETKLPFPVKMALKFQDQAQFEPMKFLYVLAEELDIYENTKVLKVSDHCVRTKFGCVNAEKIVFATHFPFQNWPGFYFARMYQDRSYVLAFIPEQRILLDGMYYGVDEDGLSFRNVNDIVLMGGMGHRTGACQTLSPYDRLRERAKKIFGDFTEAAAWSAQDCMTLDSIPYIGTFSENRRNWYVATGFGKWGMSGSMVSAMVIRDLILGKDTPEWNVFSPQRSMGAAAYGNLLRNMVHTAKNFLVPGGPRCSHLGCRLKWNRSEKTWDCPCHGSRFGKEGNLLDAPARKDIKRPGPESNL